MKPSILRPWLIALFLLLGTPFLDAQTAAKVARIEIKHVGPPATSDALIRANIRVKEGDAFQRTRVDDDVRNLYGTGYFYNIRVVEGPAADGVELVYVLQGNPTLTDIKFTGNKKFSNSKLLKKVTAKTGSPLEEKKLFADAKELEKAYQKVGYQKTTVKPLLSIDENAGRGSVTFEIKETGKVKINEIVFEGASSFTQKKLRKQFKTKSRWWMSWLTGSGVLKDEQFEDDKDKLVEFYQNEGYIDFEIKEVKFDYPGTKKMVIHFVLTEGRRYKVGAVNISGNKLFTTPDFDKGILTEGKLVRMRMGSGETFTPKGLTKDTDALRDFYGSKGYIDTRVNAAKSPNPTTGTMDLVYEIEEGDKAFIERIDIKGNDKTKDKVIRRELAVSPGEVFDMTRVKLSKERLEGLNFFEKVDTRSEDTDIPNRKNLVVGVEEKSTGSFTIGAGLSSVDSVVGFVEVSQSNFDLFKAPTFCGAGQKFRMRAQLGTQRADYQISFVEPWFLQRKLALGVDLFHRELDYVSRTDLYSQTESGVSFNLTKALGSEFLIGRIGYTIEHIKVDFDDQAHTNTLFTYIPFTNSLGVPGTITNPIPANVSPTFFDEAGGRIVSKVTGSLIYDTRNSALLPSRGQRSELLGEFAGLGGDTAFYKMEGKTTWYIPGFFDGHIFEISGRVGVVNDWGSGDRGRSRVPVSDRWFLGGLYSLRGFRFREVGPKDTGSTGEPIGGNTYLFGSAEYSLPIIERLRLALFYDVGNVYDKAFSFNAAGRRFVSDDVGLGLRINLPIGPLRLDYGIPLQRDANATKSGRFNFSIGYTREY